MEREPKMETDGRARGPRRPPSARSVAGLCLSVENDFCRSQLVSDRSIFLIISSSHGCCILTPRRKCIPQEVQRREGMVPDDGCQ